MGVIDLRPRGVGVPAACERVAEPTLSEAGPRLRHCPCERNILLLSRPVHENTVVAIYKAKKVSTVVCLAALTYLLKTRGELCLVLRHGTSAW